MTVAGRTAQPLQPAAPFARWSAVLAAGLGCLALAVVLATFPLASMAGQLNPQIVASTLVALAFAVVGLLVVDMLAALALAASGTAITAIIPSAPSAQPVLMLTYIPLIVLGGAFGAITSLPHWVNTAMTYLPVQPAIACNV